MMMDVLQQAWVLDLAMVENVAEEGEFRFLNVIDQGCQKMTVGLLCF